MYNALKIQPDDRIVIIAPHPDDETIGCGGILAIFGAQCDVVLLTDGRLGKPEGSDLTEEQTAMIRHKEFVNVMDYFHVNSYYELQIPDGTVKESFSSVSNINLRKYHYIFVPNRYERHPDHKAAYELVNKLYKQQGANGAFVEYEVWSPLVAANRFLDISSVMNTKIAGLALYESQIASINYEWLSRGLNMYRGAPHHVAYCEAYYLIKKNHKNFTHMIKKKLSKELRKHFGKFRK